jgi:hypothetical protein
VEAATEAEAIQWPAKLPGAKLAPIDVRPLMEFEERAELSSDRPSASAQLASFVMSLRVQIYLCHFWNGLVNQHPPILGDVFAEVCGCFGGLDQMKPTTGFFDGQAGIVGDVGAIGRFRRVPQTMKIWHFS